LKISVSVDVPSLDEGVRFYGTAFGFIEQSRPHEGYAIIASGDASIGLLAKPGGSSPAKDCDDVRRYDRHWTPVHMDFNVDDSDSALASALAAGATCEQLHRISGYPPVAFCSDPFGHGFCIIGPRN